MFQLINWLTFRLRWFYYFPSKTLGLPMWVGAILAIAVVILFLWALYDLFAYRKRGDYPPLWLLIVLLVPLGSALYLLVGSRQLRMTPEPKSSTKPVNQSDKTAVPKAYTPYTHVSNKIIIFGGLLLMGFIVALLMLVNSQGLATTTYDEAARYSSLAGTISWPFAIIAGAWMAYIVTHPRKLRQRSGILTIFLGLLGFFLGLVPGFILALVITYPLSNHACRLSGSKYC